MFHRKIKQYPSFEILKEMKFSLLNLQLTKEYSINLKLSKNVANLNKSNNFTYYGR